MNIKRWWTRVLGPVLLLGATNSALAESVTAMLERVLPAVVTVVVEETQTTYTPFGFAGEASATAYARVLDLTEAEQTGSGFIITHDGEPYVVTNAHVVEQAAGDDSLFVYTIDQRKFPVRIVGGDSFYDLAVLAFVDAPPTDGIASLRFRDTPPSIGEPTYTIGNPLGSYPYSVSDGIVSGLNRLLSGLTAKHGYLQTTATLSWGNSGGPLVDASGAVLGVNTRIEITEMGRQAVVLAQINFALEADMAQRLVHDILEHGGRMQRAFLGIEVAELSPLRGARHRPEAPMLMGILPDSPAAGVLADAPGHTIVAVNDEPVRNLEEVLGALEAVVPGDEVEFTLLTPRGREYRASFTSARLDTKELSAIARYLFHRHARSRVSDEQHGVQLAVESTLPDTSPTAATPTSGKTGSHGFQKEQRRYQPQDQTGPTEAVIVAAGVIADTEEPSLWRVTTLVDLGVAIRLAALSGYLDIVPVIGGGEQVLRIRLADDPQQLARTLFY